SARVAFGPTYDGGSPITSYTATCTAPSEPTGTTSGAGSPLIVTGLTVGVQYSCTVRATNALGTGAASSAATVTPTATGPPDTPTGVTAVVDSFGFGGQAVVSFTPASDGGLPPLDFTVTCTGPGPTTFTGTGSSSPITVF